MWAHRADRCLVTRCLLSLAALLAQSSPTVADTPIVILMDDRRFGSGFASLSFRASLTKYCAALVACTLIYKRDSQWAPELAQTSAISRKCEMKGHNEYLQHAHNPYYLALNPLS